jgi:hypothetical protein
MKSRFTKMKWIITLSVLFCCSITVLRATEPADHQAVQPRPIQLGVSGSSIDYIDGGYCCGGTIGSLVEDINGTQYILSNNHVLARTNRGVPGEDIIQPGLIDVGCGQDPQDVVADLTGYVPIQFSGSNVADAAIAEVRAGQVDGTGSILGIGPTGSTTLPASIGLKVKKAGRTTGVTFGEVGAIDVTAKVIYSKRCGGNGGPTATFVNQILITPGTFSDGGDSGSLIVEDVATSPRAVGLLFAGSTSYTLANPIGPVLSAFGVAMVGGVPNQPTPTPPPPTPTPTPQPGVTGGISGRVTSRANGGPIAGAKVSVDTGQSDLTDTDGAYLISGVPVGQRTVKASAKKYLTQAQMITVAEMSTTVVDFALDQKTTGKRNLAPAKQQIGIGKAREVKARYEAGLHGIRGVVGSGIGLNGKGQPVIDVYLEQDSPDLRADIPAAVEGVPTRIVVTGLFIAD